jgi:hypothetical protein
MVYRLLKLIFISLNYNKKNGSETSLSKYYIQILSILFPYQSFPNLAFNIVQMDAKIAANIQKLTKNIQSSATTFWSKPGLHRNWLWISIMEMAKLGGGFHTSSATSTNCDLWNLIKIYLDGSNKAHSNWTSGHFLLCWSSAAKDSFGGLIIDDMAWNAGHKYSILDIFLCGAQVTASDFHKCSAFDWPRFRCKLQMERKGI